MGWTDGEPTTETAPLNAKFHVPQTLRPLQTDTVQAERSGGYVAVLLCSALWLRKSLTGAGNHFLF